MCTLCFCEHNSSNCSHQSNQFCDTSTNYRHNRPGRRKFDETKWQSFFRIPLFKMKDWTEVSFERKPEKKPYSNFWTGLLRVWPSYCFHFIRSFHRLFFWAWNEIKWPCNNRTATQWIQRNDLVLALIYQPVTEVRPSEQLWDGSRRVGSSDRKETRETKWNNIADVHWYYWHMHLTGVYL